MNSARPIWRFVRPCVRTASTSISRGLRPRRASSSSAESGAGADGEWAFSRCTGSSSEVRAQAAREPINSTSGCGPIQAAESWALRSAEAASARTVTPMGPEAFPSRACASRKRRCIGRTASPQPLPPRPRLARQRGPADRVSETSRKRPAPGHTDTTPWVGILVRGHEQHRAACRAHEGSRQIERTAVGQVSLDSAHRPGAFRPVSEPVATGDSRHSRSRPATWERSVLLALARLRLGHYVGAEDETGRLKVQLRTPSLDRFDNHPLAIPLGPSDLAIDGVDIR